MKPCRGRRREPLPGALVAGAQPSALVPATGSLAQVTPNIRCHDADFRDRGFQLLLGHTERLGPVAELVSFVDVDATSVGGATVLKIV
jgi:hypothetical protein